MVLHTDCALVEWRKMKFRMNAECQSSNRWSGQFRFQDDYWGIVRLEGDSLKVEGPKDYAVRNLLVSMRPNMDNRAPVSVAAVSASWVCVCDASCRR